MDINKKHKAFADNLMKDPERNARRAYKKVYGNKIKDNAADTAAWRLLKNVKVAEYIAEIEKTNTGKVIATNERIIEEYAKIAFLDPAKIFNSDGSIKDIHDIDDETRGVIAGIECEALFEGRGESREMIGTLKKIKLADKIRALDSLSRIKGMFKDNVNVKITIDDIIEEE